MQDGGVLSGEADGAEAIAADDDHVLNFPRGARLSEQRQASDAQPDSNSPAGRIT
jgi:hypothetical protein